MWLPTWLTCRWPTGRTGRAPDHGRTARAATSRDDFIAHQMQTKTRGRGPVEVKRFHGFAHIGAQLFPGVGLRDDAFAQRLGDVAAVGFLGDFKNELVHGTNASAFSL